MMTRSLFTAPSSLVKYTYAFLLVLRSDILLGAAIESEELDLGPDDVVGLELDLHLGHADEYHPSPGPDGTDGSCCR